MGRKLKVYGWTAIIGEDLRVRLGLERWHRQARAVVAAISLKQVGEIVGVPYRHLFNLCETGNAHELAICLAEPGVVFVGTLNGPRAAYVKAEGSLLR